MTRWETQHLEKKNVLSIKKYKEEKQFLAYIPE